MRALFFTPGGPVTKLLVEFFDRCRQPVLWSITGEPGRHVAAADFQFGDVAKDTILFRSFQKKIAEAAALGIEVGDRSIDGLALLRGNDIDLDGDIGTRICGGRPYARLSTAQPWCPDAPW